MGMTIAEKILASKSGHASVTPGQIVDAYPDLVMSHTATWRSVSVMEKTGATRLYDPERIAIVLDHISPAKTEKNWADLICRMGAICQLLARIRSTGWENLGAVATRFILNKCRTSIPRQLLRNALRLSGRDTPAAVGLSL